MGEMRKSFQLGDQQPSSDGSTLQSLAVYQNSHTQISGFSINAERRGAEGWEGEWSVAVTHIIISFRCSSSKYFNPYIEGKRTEFRDNGADGDSGFVPGG